jgi:hypothetical protein
VSRRGSPQECRAVLAALAVPNRDNAPRKIDILDPQADRLDNSQSGVVHQRGQQPVGHSQRCDDGHSLLVRQDHRQPGRPLRANGCADIAERLLQHLIAKKDQGIQAWFCVAAATWRRTASQVRNVCTSSGPIVDGWRRPWKRMKWRIQYQYDFPVRTL